MGEVCKQYVCQGVNTPNTGLAKAEAPILGPPDAESTPWKRPGCWERLEQEKRVTEDEMIGWHHQLNSLESEQTQGDSEGQGNLACCSPWGHKESHMTEQLNNHSRVG